MITAEIAEVFRRESQSFPYIFKSQWFSYSLSVLSGNWKDLKPHFSFRIRELKSLVAARFSVPYQIALLLLDFV